ncbi:cation:proton antiporter domain-containing protein [Bauldia litoralis]|uniref:Kef-type potassium/proton antiporter, CPA2 family n=1 Tax=Bauldia litoralis TaxID=665467 RepID=A0A1G6D8Y7_9HYPH|nr:cation:proton antiporter [Bauldia litoralis]SDB41529.1 Kef-type potassium/proton antiporter, CPA2 family [Bauldia litoralis]
MFEHESARELLIVLGTAGVVVPLFGKMRFGVVPGFLLAGLLLGPGGLGAFVSQVPWLSYITFSNPERVAPIAELGVIFLLFLIGLEFSFDRLWAMRRYVLGVGSLQVFISAAAILGIALLVGLNLPGALVLGLALALSSTAIVTQVLIEAHRFALPVGRLVLSVLVFQDLMVVPIVIVVGLLGGASAGEADFSFADAGIAVAVVAGIIVFGRIMQRPLLRLTTGTGSRELVVAIGLFMAIGAAVLTAQVGLSPALGAFLAGLLLGETEYRHQIEVDIEPFKGLLLGLFFMTVGMSLNLAAITIGPLAFVAAVVTLVLVKGLVMIAVARAFGVDLSVAIEAGFLLAGAGEFAFVVFTLASQHDLVAPGLLQFLVSVSALSMFVVPFLGKLGQRVGKSLAERRDGRDHGAGVGESEELSDHVIIGGFGRVGEMVARLLTEERIPWVALDLDAAAVSEAHAAGRPVFYGDASRREFLERVGAARARAFVVTTDAPGATEDMVAAIRQSWPKAAIHARARDSAHAEVLIKLGVSAVTPETLEASLQLARGLLMRIGLPEDATDNRLAAMREIEMREIGKGRD